VVFFAGFALGVAFRFVAVFFAGFAFGFGAHRSRLSGSANRASLAEVVTLILWSVRCRGGPPR
jgi:hypothetical protein